MVKLFRMFSNLRDHNPPTLQTDRRTDRQTTCDRNTALCTKVHRAVKSENLDNDFYVFYVFFDMTLQKNVKKRILELCCTYIVKYFSPATMRSFVIFVCLSVCHIPHTPFVQSILERRRQFVFYEEITRSLH